MKTAYELAMERLNKAAPATKLTGAQKKQLAELDSTCAAKIAGREITLKDEISKFAAAGDLEKVETLQQQWVNERKKLQAGLEEKKEQIRRSALAKGNWDPACRAVVRSICFYVPDSPSSLCRGAAAFAL